MKRVLLIVILLGGCEAVPELTSVTSTLTAGELAGTWQAARATLALTPTGDYTYVAPNGAIVGPGRWSVEGNTLRLSGFPDATVTLSGSTLAVTMPDTMDVYQRAATYCVPTNAQQSCR